MGIHLSDIDQIRALKIGGRVGADHSTRKH